MLRSYLLTTYRNMMRNKAYSSINILGLSVGMATCFFIFHYITFESGYDKFNKKSDRLYRVIMENKTGSIGSLSATTHPGVGPTMKKDYAEVENYTRLVDYNLLYNIKEISYLAPDGSVRSFYQNRVFVADPSFFSVFSYQLKAGEPGECLSHGDDIVISEALAKKYFGNDNPLGKTLRLNERMLFKVSGVFADVPDNSHVKFDILISTKAEPRRIGEDEFDWPEFYNYVVLKQGVDAESFSKKLSGFADAHMKDLMKTYNFKAQFSLQKVTDIHLQSHYGKEAEANGSQAELDFLKIIGVFILVIAWINYINLSTARSIDRSKEVGLRKVVGASRRQVFMQFLVESVVINTLSLLVALSLVLAAWPFTTAFLGKNINDTFFTAGLGSLPEFWMALPLIFIAGCLLVGVYPALIFSSFTPVSLFKSLIRRSVTGIVLRKGLVAFQFALSILLIAATVIIYKQLSYSRQQNLGYDIHKVVVAKSPANTWQKFSEFDYLKTALMKHSFIDAVTSSSDIPGEQIRYQNSARRIGQDKAAGKTTNQIEVDHNFIATYNIPIIAGRAFERRDTMNLLTILEGTVNLDVIINEKLASDLGFAPASSAANKQIVCMFGASDVVCNVVGVMKNIHQRSLKDKYEGMLLYCPVKTMWKYVSIRLQPGNTASSLASIEKTYKSVFPGSPFEYFFLDDYFNKQYAGDETLGKVFMLFSVIAIVVACLGLWGLASFTLKLRTREVGIRKVLGASVKSLLYLLTVDYVKLALLASAVTLPVIYLAANRWLENFAFHFQPGVKVMVAPAVLLLCITLATIFFQTLKASLKNPVAAIKTE